MWVKLSISFIRTHTRARHLQRLCVRACMYVPVYVRIPPCVCMWVNVLACVYWHERFLLLYAFILCWLDFIYHTRHGMRLEFQIYYYFSLTHIDLVENKRQIWFASNNFCANIFNAWIVRQFSITNILVDQANTFQFYSWNSDFYCFVFHLQLQKVHLRLDNIK